MDPGWDEPPLDVHIPDDARELDRDVLAYHRELRARRRRSRLARLTSPFGGQGTVLPLLASILAVCLVAGAMLSVATFSPATAPAVHGHQPASATASPRPAPQRPSPSSPRTSRSLTGSAAARPTAASRTASHPGPEGSPGRPPAPARSHPGLARQTVPPGGP